MKLPEPRGRMELARGGLAARTRHGGNDFTVEAIPGAKIGTNKGRGTSNKVRRSCLINESEKE